MTITKRDDVVSLRRRWTIYAVGLLAVSSLPALSANPASKSDSKPVPPPATKGVVVLFSGTKADMEKNWVRGGGDQPAAWRIEDGAMIATGSDIRSRDRFSDFQLHVEFRVPYMPEAHGQARGNSGVYLQGRYEIQVLDSYGIESPGTGDCGAIYGQAAPLVNACRPPMEWQTYDVFFRAARFDPNTGDETEPPRVTVLQNGIAIQNNEAIRGGTGGRRRAGERPEGPILLQFHDNAVAYRDIWVVPLPPKGADHY